MHVILKYFLYFDILGYLRIISCFAYIIWKSAFQITLKMIGTWRLRDIWRLIRKFKNPWLRRNICWYLLNAEKSNNPILNSLYHFLALGGWDLMRLAALDDLRQRIPPRLSKYHSLEQNPTDKYHPRTGVTYWRKANFTYSYCEARNGYVCQRPAAAGSASEANGNFMLLKNIRICKG